MRTFGWLAAVASLALSSAARAQPDPLDEATRAYRALEVEHATALLDQVLAAQPPPATRARALVLRALVAYQLGDARAVDENLREALRVDPTVAVPDFAPPAVRDQVEAARPRSEPVRDQRPRTPAAAPAPRVRPAVAPRAPSTGVAHRAWPWWLGAAGALVVTGGAYALALTTKGEAEGSPHARDEVDDLQTRYDAARVTTLVGAVVTLGLAIVGTLMLGPDQP